MGRKGLPKAYIKKWGVTKLAWKKFRAKALSKSKPRKAKTTRKKSNPKRRRRNLARKNKRRGGKSIYPTLFRVVRVGALAAPAIAIGTKPIPNYDKTKELIRAYTGYDIGTPAGAGKHFSLSYLMQGWGPFLGATLATYGIPKIAGLIRRL